MMGGFSVDSLHEQKFQIIGRTQILWHSRCCYSLFPQNMTALLSQGIEVSLVIINNGLIETALQFLQCHASRLRRYFSIVDTIRCVGESLFKTLRHPPKERF